VRVRAILLPLSLVFALAAAGTSPSTEDPLWARAAASVSLAKNAVASRIVTRTEVFDGSGKKMESVEEVQKLTGWDGEKPLVKTETKRDVVRDSGLKVRIELKATDNPFYASRQGLVAYNRTGEDTLDGKNCVRFQFEEAQGPADKSEGPIVGTAWVERESGLPVKVEYHPKKLPARVSAYTMTVLFEGRPDGSAVPREADLEMKGGFLFIKRVVRLHKSLIDWTTTPNVKD
jgi:hypothetical protein